MSISANLDMDLTKNKRYSFFKSASSVGIDFSITTSSKQSSQKGLLDLFSLELR